MNHNHSINWSDKVKSLDKNIRDEIGIEGENEAKHILIRVQTKSAERMKHFSTSLYCPPRDTE